MRREQWEQLRETPWPLHSRRASWGMPLLGSPTARFQGKLSYQLSSLVQRTLCHRHHLGVHAHHPPRTPFGRPSVIPWHLIRPLSALGGATHTLLLEDFPLRFYLYSLEFSFSQWSSLLHTHCLMSDSPLNSFSSSQLLNESVP